MNDDELALGLDQLSPRELVAFKTVVQMRAPSVSPATSTGFFQLYLAGRSCVEIADLNKGFTLGQIVRCRVEGEWDRKLKEHKEQLMRETMQQLTQVKLESLRHLSDMLRVHHTLYGEKMAKFLQTRDENELAGVPLPAYKVLVTQLVELTEEKGPSTVVVNQAAPERVVEGKVTGSKPTREETLQALASKLKKADE